MFQIISHYQPLNNTSVEKSKPIKLSQGKISKEVLSRCVLEAYSKCRNFKEVEKVKNTIETIVGQRRNSHFISPLCFDKGEPAKKLYHDLQVEYATDLSCLFHEESNQETYFHNPNSDFSTFDEFLYFSTKILYKDGISRLNKLPKFLDPRYSSRSSSVTEKREILKNQNAILSCMKIFHLKPNILEMRKGNIYIKRCIENKSFHIFLLDKNRSYIEENSGTRTSGGLKLVKANSFFVYLTEKQVRQSLRYQMFDLLIDQLFIRHFISLSRPNTRSIMSRKKKPQIFKYNSIFLRKMKDYTPDEIHRIEKDGFCGISILDNQAQRKLIYIAPYLGEDLISCFMKNTISCKNEYETKLLIFSLFETAISKYRETCGKIYDLKLENILYFKEFKRYDIIDYNDKVITKDYIIEDAILTDIIALSLKLKNETAEIRDKAYIQYVINNRIRIFYNNLTATLLKIAQISRILDFNSFFFFFTEEVVPTVLKGKIELQEEFLKFLTTNKDLLENYFYKPE